MEHENLNIKELMESRRHAIEQSLRTISVAELKSLGNKLFPSTDHPWSETFSNLIDDPHGGTFYHGNTDDHVEVLYCHDKDMGLWFIPGVGKGRLQPEELKIMKEVVEARRNN